MQEDYAYRSCLEQTHQCAVVADLNEVGCEVTMGVTVGDSSTTSRHRSGTFQHTISAQGQVEGTLDTQDSHQSSCSRCKQGGAAGAHGADYASKGPSLKEGCNKSVCNSRGAAQMELSTSSSMNSGCLSADDSVLDIVSGMFRSTLPPNPF
jgi:hypothetical protein